MRIRNLFNWCSLDVTALVLLLMGLLALTVMAWDDFLHTNARGNPINREFIKFSEEELDDPNPDFQTKYEWWMFDNELYRVYQQFPSKEVFLEEHKQYPRYEEIKERLETVLAERE